MHSNKALEGSCSSFQLEYFLYPKKMKIHVNLLCCSCLIYWSYKKIKCYNSQDDYDLFSFFEVKYENFCTDTLKLEAAFSFFSVFPSLHIPVVLQGAAIKINQLSMALASLENVSYCASSVGINTSEYIDNWSHLQ